MSDISQLWHSGKSFTKEMELVVNTVAQAVLNPSQSCTVYQCLDQLLISFCDSVHQLGYNPFCRSSEELQGQ